MKNVKRHIIIRLPKSKIGIFNENKEKIPEIVDRILREDKEIKRNENFEIYSERVSLTVDIIYYEKPEELAKKYKMPISTLVRNIIFQLS